MPGAARQRMAWQGRAAHGLARRGKFMKKSGKKAVSSLIPALENVYGRLLSLMTKASDRDAQEARQRQIQWRASSTYTTIFRATELIEGVLEREESRNQKLSPSCDGRKIEKQSNQRKN
jgi:hypothetical protein